MTRIRTPEGLMRQAIGFLEEEAQDYIAESKGCAPDDSNAAYFMARANRMLMAAAGLQFLAERGAVPTTGQKRRLMTLKLRHFGVLPKLPPKDRRWELELAEYEASLPDARPGLTFEENATMTSMRSDDEMRATRQGVSHD